jgi:hypothetical protein
MMLSAAVAASVVVADFADVLVELVLLLASEVSVELISTNCSRLFTATNWLTYSLGSALEVGS